jgi:hypothetical protein
VPLSAEVPAAEKQTIFLAPFNVSAGSLKAVVGLLVVIRRMRRIKRLKNPLYRLAE